MPKNKEMKLHFEKFAAKETYKGLGTGVNENGLTGLRDNLGEPGWLAVFVGAKAWRWTY